ncbi:hypothetical protein FGO68_gene4482 [Halteria grandinella]|uniref:Uncharacterized protein n=1 Tax=Halteria grandinella TaxID=5974 RepID=A0A8J8T4F8_HALGN|nr:hypothetical protein FGO68_gene4482 [Halteria grandinella]
MFADTTYTMKSGQYGSPMFSRSGKVTNYQYLCFNNEYGEPRTDFDSAEEAQQLKDHLLEQHRQLQQQLHKQQQSKQQMLDKTVTSEKPTNGNQIMSTLSNKLRDSLGFQQGAFKAAQSDAMNITAKSKLPDPTTKNAGEGKKKKEEDEESEGQQEEGPLYIAPIPGVNTSSFLGVNRDKVVATIYTPKDGLHLMCKYNPKYHKIDRRIVQDVDFDGVEERPVLFENKELKKEENAMYQLCTKLTNTLNQSMKKLEAGGQDKKRPSKKQVKFRASTIVNSPKNKDFEGIVSDRGMTSPLATLQEKASSSVLLSQNDTENGEKQRTIIKGQLQIDANELYMVSQYLKRDVKPLADPRCLVDYQKNQDRDFYYDYIAGAHEGRFDNINRLPHPLTNIRHIAAPSFTKSSRRQPLFLSSAKYPIDYRIESGLRSPDPLSQEFDQNKATGRHRNLSQGIPDLSKMSIRKFHAPPKPFKIPDSYDPWRIKNASELQSKFKKTVNPVGFDKMLPRDNKMFMISDGYNLEPKPEPSIIEKLASLDIDIRKLRIKHSSTSTSYYSESTAHSYAGNSNAKPRQAGGDYLSEVSKTNLNATNQSKNSLKSRRTELSLEEKLLKGYYKQSDQ